MRNGACLCGDICGWRPERRQSHDAQSFGGRRSEYIAEGPLQGSPAVDNACGVCTVSCGRWFFLPLSAYPGDRCGPVFFCSDFRKTAVTIPLSGGHLHHCGCARDERSPVRRGCFGGNCSRNSLCGFCLSVSVQRKCCGLQTDRRDRIHDGNCCGILL